MKSMKKGFFLRNKQVVYAAIASIFLLGTASMTVSAEPAYDVNVARMYQEEIIVNLEQESNTGYKAKEGQTVTVTSPEPIRVTNIWGPEFHQLEVAASETEENTYTFVMPAEKVIIGKKHNEIDYISPEEYPMTEKSEDGKVEIILNPIDGLGNPTCAGECSVGRMVVMDGHPLPGYKFVKAESETAVFEDELKHISPVDGYTEVWEWTTTEGQHIIDFYYEPCDYTIHVADNIKEYIQMIPPYADADNVIRVVMNTAEVEEIIIEGCEIEKVEDGVFSFIMPDRDVTIELPADSPLLNATDVVVETSSSENAMEVVGGTTNKENGNVDATPSESDASIINPLIIGIIAIIFGAGIGTGIYMSKKNKNV